LNIDTATVRQSLVVA